MGMKLFSSSSYDRKGDCRCDPPPPSTTINNSSTIINNYATLQNPDPNNYSIIDSAYYSKLTHDVLVVRIKYPDCTNYEGVKILVYENVSLDDLKSQKSIDPHFSENKKYYSPIARFEPTEKGWKNANNFAKSLL